VGVMDLHTAIETRGGMIPGPAMIKLSFPFSSPPYSVLIITLDSLVSEHGRLTN
jgi:hypothetical protein